MAAVIPTNLDVRDTDGGRYALVRSVTDQATTGQTDYIWVPAWARCMVVYFNVVCKNTTPNSLLTLVTTDPVIMNDGGASTGGGSSRNVGNAAISGGITSNGNVCITVMPSETGIADKIVVGASGGTVISINTRLPQFVGLKVTNDRSSGDETYTYKVGVEFYGQGKMGGFAA